MSLQPRTQRFEQVKADLMAAIANEQFAPGDRLPSLRSLCAHFGVSLVTVQRAVQELKDEEWLVASPRKGITVAESLPPVARLMRLREKLQESNASATAAPQGAEYDRASLGGSRIALKCLLHHNGLLPLFEWAAQEFAEACAPYSIRFDVMTLRGRDDDEAMQSIDSDLVLLPSYSISRAAQAGSITPARGMLSHAEKRFAEIIPEALDLVSWRGDVWGMPIMMGGAILTAHEAQCRNAGIDPSALNSVDALLHALETSAQRGDADKGDSILFNLTYPLWLVVGSGCDVPSPADMPEMLSSERVRALLERLKNLGKRRAIQTLRFDLWESVDFPKLAVRHMPSGRFCQDAATRAGARVLPIPSNGTVGSVLATYALCVSARSIHPYEAWEWAARLGGETFQTRFAEMGYDIPVSRRPEVWQAFGKAVGAKSAEALLGLAQRPSRFFSIRPDDAMRYLWEVVGNEAYRFVAGLNGYERFLERVTTKTDRFLRRHEKVAVENTASDAAIVAAGG